MLQQAAILAGGLGIRLRSVVADRPKPMAEFRGRPFLEYQIRFLREQGIREIILCIGYLADEIHKHFGDGSGWDVTIRYSRETEPLGTGGALKLAEPLLGETFLLLNGDTFLACELGALEEHHRVNQADVTLAVSKADDASSYGSVEVGADGRATGFREKAVGAHPGYVNVGLYVMNKALVAVVPAGRRVSLEQDLFKGWVKTRRVFAFVLQGGFVDIGTPEGYERFASRVMGSRLG